MHKSMKYYLNKTKIDKAQHKKTAYKIQFFNNMLIDKLVEDYEDAGESSRPADAVIWAELAILNKPEVYKNYNRIINSKYTSNDALYKMLIKNKANANLEHIVESELERIAKNLDFVEQVMKKYEIPTKEYQKLVKQQKESSVANRKDILEKVAIKANDLLVSEGLNIPSNVFSYRSIETTAQSLLRQSQMTANYERINGINENYVNEGKDAIFTHKTWINTGRKNTRHMSNHMQTVLIEEPFIVVHDKMLVIDEMMYPCDPAGSKANAYICYCDCDYHNEDKSIYEGVFDLRQPVTNNYVAPSQPATPNVTFAPSLNQSVKTELAKPKGKYIDVSKLEKVANSNKGSGYLANTDNGLKYNKETGKAYYNGLEANVVQYNESIDYGSAFFKELDVLEHNIKYPKSSKTKLDNYVEAETIKTAKTKPKEVIDTAEIDYAKFDDYYMLNESDGAYKNKDGKWEYKGLVADEPSYTGKSGYFKIESVAKHNYEVTGKKPVEAPTKPNEILSNNVKNNTLADEIVEGELINADDLIFSESNNAYYMDIEAGIKKNSKTGKWEYKGLEVKDYSEKWDIGTITADEIKAHNNKIRNKNPKEPVKTESKKEIIDGSKLNELDSESYDIDPTLQPHLEKDIKINKRTGKYEYKGLEIKGEYEKDGYGWIDKVDVEKHNAKLTGKTKSEKSKVHKEIIDEHDLIYAPEDGGYLVADYQLTYEAGEYYYNGLKVKKTNDGMYPSVITEAQIKAHNKSISLKDGLQITNRNVRGHESLKLAKDADGQKYAVYENEAYVLDDKYKYEKLQDELQNKIDMSEYYNAVNDWGYGGYSKINHFNYLKKTFADPKYKQLHDEVVPLLDKHRNAVFEGKGTKRIYNKINKVINKYKASAEFDSTDKVFKVIEEIRDIDTAMAKAPALQQNTCFLRAGAWDLLFNKVGKIIEWDGFAGISYKDRPVDLGHESLSYNITILAPKGAKGIRLSKQFDAITGEREWLLPRGQKFRVLEFDEEAHTCVIELIVEGF